MPVRTSRPGVFKRRAARPPRVATSSRYELSVSDEHAHLGPCSPAAPAAPKVAVRSLAVGVHVWWFTYTLAVYVRA